MDDPHTRRIKEEFKRMLTQYNPKRSHIKWRLIDRDLHRYQLLIPGVKGSVYEGGKWIVTIDLPPEYPFKPPICNFVTPIWHPNIGVGGTRWKWGSNVCLSLVNHNNIGKPGGWKETIPLTSVVDHLELMLEIFPGKHEPEDFPEYLVDPKDPFNPDAARQLLENFEIFEKTVKEWIEKHAKHVSWE